MKFSMLWSNFSAPRLRYTSRMAARCMVLALLAVVPLSAFAQSPTPDPTWIGAGVRTRPAYDGSGAPRTHFIPPGSDYRKPSFPPPPPAPLHARPRTEPAP